MPTITDIKKQKRSDTRFSVYLDGDYSFALTDLELSTSGLRVGQELSADEVEDYQRSADQAKAYALALRFLSFRPRSTREMRDYFKRKDVEPEDAEAAIERLTGARLLDDRAFALSWVASRQALRVRSKRVLEMELFQKGISKDLIAEAVGEIDADMELQSLVGLIEKKSRLPQYQDREKLTGYLARQGYSYHLIKRALDAAS